MISKNIPHTYIQNGIRYFAFLCPVRHSDDFKAYNFNVFDEEGYSWFQVTHGTLPFIKSLFPYIFQKRTILEVDEQEWIRSPIINSDHKMVSGNAEMGYMLEGLREGLGLDLILFKNLLGEVDENENR